MRPPEALSATAISLYLTCSLKYRFQYVDRLPRLTLSENQAFGTAIHAALNWLHKARKRGHTPPLTEVLQVFEADWYAQTQAEGTKVQFDDVGDAAALGYKGRELLTQYYHLPASRVLDSEVWFTLPLVNPATGEALDVPIRGAMDLIEEGDVIVEFKAPQKAPPITALPDDIQVTTYAYAYEKLFGRLPKDIRKVALVRTKVPRVDPPQITGRDHKDFERLFHLGREVVKGVRAGVFLPSRGCWLCNDCEYRQDCDEWAGNEEEEANAQRVG